MQEFQLEEYLSHGVERIVKEILALSASNPRESMFMLHFAGAEKKARILRARAEAAGEHIPPFLISSITEQCNLHCKGCYAQANCASQNRLGRRELTASQWEDLFSQAEELGISFILLAGGEPLTRIDVLEAAASHKKLIFPVFTNGTMMDRECLKLFDSCRNLIPVLSIEGGPEATDSRRGVGVYRSLQRSMEALRERKLLFGSSITVTTENIREVTSDEFVDGLKMQGCKAVIYVEYVPVGQDNTCLAPGEEERRFLERKLLGLRECCRDMLFISFPGDEKSSGGCLAAGRGFFHINAHGGAEPCPFSPYSDTSLLHTSLREALHSPLFRKLQGNGLLEKAHTGGCVLFQQEQQIKNLLEAQ